MNEETHKQILARLRAKKPRPGKVKTMASSDPPKPRKTRARKPLERCIAEPDCEELGRRRGMCDLHYQRSMRGAKRKKGAA